VGKVLNMRCSKEGEPVGELIDYYRGADKSLARPTSRCILFDDENISFDASLLYRAIVLIFLQLW
jgi:hypothetical protein